MCRHSLTLEGRISHSRATTAVPPKLSMISPSVIGTMIGTPNHENQGIPNDYCVRFTYMETWGTRIAARRRQLGMDQPGFARQCKVSAPTVSDWESGKIKTITGPHLLQAAKVLGVSPYWILEGKGEQFDPRSLCLLRALESLPENSKTHLQAVADAFAQQIPWDGINRRKIG